MTPSNIDYQQTDYREQNKRSLQAQQFLKPYKQRPL